MGDMMAVKTTGVEFKKFYTDPAFWPEGWFHDDGYISVDGDEEADPMSAKDNSTIVIEGGIVFEGDYSKEGPFMESHFKKWRKLQTVEFLTVEIPKGTADKLKEFIKTLKA